MLTKLNFPEKYHIDTVNKLISEYRKLKEVDREQWLQEQTEKWRVISAVKQPVPIPELQLANSVAK